MSVHLSSPFSFFFELKDLVRYTSYSLMLHTMYLINTATLVKVLLNVVSISLSLCSTGPFHNDK
jgi:hypothetical protein